jgi:hypothetical protein
MLEQAGSRVSVDLFRTILSKTAQTRLFDRVSGIMRSAPPSVRQHVGNAMRVR